MRRRSASFVSALLLFAAAAPGALALPFGVGGSSGPKSVEFAPDNPADAATHLAPSTVQALQGVHRVAIAQVLVEYVDHSQGLTRKERGQISIQYGFQGPAAEAMQAQTDKLADRLAAQLTAAGFEVVPREEVEATAGWKKLAGIAKPSGGDFKSESGSGRLFAGGARPYWFYPGDQHLGTGAMGWGFANAQVAEQAMATELNAAVVTLRVVVGIRETDKHNNSPIFAIVKTASSFIGEPRIEVEAPYSGLFVVVPGKTGGMMKPTARAGFAVKDDLLFHEDLLMPTLKDANGATGAAGNAASTALFAATALANFYGGGMSGKLYKSYKFEATPAEADYLSAVDRNLSGLEDALVAQLKAAAQ